MRKVTDKMLGQSDRGENVLKLLQITQIQHTFSNNKKIEVLSPAPLRGFPTK